MSSAGEIKASFMWGKNNTSVCKGERNRREENKGLDTRLAHDKEVAVKRATRYKK